LSFDDGFKELLQAVLPLIHRHKIPITLFIPSGIVEGDGLFPWLHNSASEPNRTTLIKHGVRDSITVSELKEIASYSEVTIGSHTVNHTITANLPDEQARFEFAESKRALDSWTGAPVRCFAYPEGRFDGRESSLLNECGYQMAATTEATLVTQENDPYLVPRFHVGDYISFPEAICNMVGVWRPAIDPIINFLRHWTVTDLLRQASRNQNPIRRDRSA
jgi:peptidoglycan/xylan/chitin deacetylase (PgdA/CDA1 family)